MKLKCKVAHQEATNGLFGVGAKPRTRIDGLTLGKEYVGNLVPLVNNFSQSTTIAASDIKAMIYNDNQEWKAYSLNLFEPA